MNAEIIARLGESLDRNYNLDMSYEIADVSNANGMISGFIGVKDSGEQEEMEQLLIAFFRSMPREKRRRL